MMRSCSNESNSMTLDVPSVHEINVPEIDTLEELVDRQRHIDQMGLTLWLAPLPNFPSTHLFTVVILSPVKTHVVERNSISCRLTTERMQPISTASYVDVINLLHEDNYKSRAHFHLRLIIPVVGMDISFEARVVDPVQVTIFEPLPTTTVTLPEAAPVAPPTTPIPNAASRDAGPGVKRAREKQPMTFEEENGGDLNTAYTKRPKITGNACQNCHERRKCCNTYTPCDNCVQRGQANECVRHVRKNAARVSKDEAQRLTENTHVLLPRGDCVYLPPPRILFSGVVYQPSAEIGNCDPCVS